MTTLPYLTPSLPGTGGLLKEDPQDFQVEEIPLYQPCGSGEHLYVTIEKRGLSTFELVRRLARALDLKERDIGYAGLKDARALTRQTLSLSGVHPAQLDGLRLEGVSIVGCAWHRNKLRLGHLAGNRFRIRLREVTADAQKRLAEIVHVLQLVGVPNYFGEQRYGLLANSHLIGRAMLRGDEVEAIRHILGDPDKIHEPRWRQAAQHFQAGDLDACLRVLPRAMHDEQRLVRALRDGQSPRQALRAFPVGKLRLYLSALQSWLFDRIVAMRMDSLDVLWPGDLAYLHDRGACFRVVDAAAEQPRAERFEISPSGPLFGHKLTLASAQAGMLEESLLASEKLSLEHFRLPGALAMAGERRPLRVPLGEFSVEARDNSLWLAFALPRGSYATSVLREIIKPQPR